jgi:Fe-S oxidoreductase
MKHVDKRPMRRLPTLEARRRELETCVYCPKLCRSACPVSNAEPRETLIPWGKMSTAFFAARGDVALEESFAAPAWACAGCYACREACDHKNDVAGTLLAARAAFVGRGLGPAAAKRTIARFEAHRAETARAVDSLGTRTSGVALLVGCTYARRLPEVARDAVAAAERLVGGVALERECCGLPLLLAGDARAFAAHMARFAGREIVAVDPGCAGALRAAGARVTLLVEAAAARLADLREGDGARAVRWHDPCQLGRGLGVYDAPRAVLTRALGRAPLEFAMRRERAECSGGGGLLPLTMPETSHAIAQKRVADAGGAEIVTACASSLLRFRKAGATATDIVTVIAGAL